MAFILVGAFLVLCGVYVWSKDPQKAPRARHVRPDPIDDPLGILEDDE